MNRKKPSALEGKVDSWIALYEEATKAILICIDNVEANMPDWHINEYVFYGMADQRVFTGLIREMINTDLLQRDNHQRLGITQEGLKRIDRL